MPSALKQCYTKVKELVTKSRTLSHALANGTATAGSRAAPPRGAGKEAKPGGRIDYGEVFKSGDKKYQNLNFQLNKQAENSTLKALVKKNGTHHVYATAPVEVTEITIPKDYIDKNGKKVAYTAEQLKKKKEEKEEKQKQRVAKALNTLESKL